VSCCAKCAANKSFLSQEENFSNACSARRSFLRARGIQPGDRCGLLGANSISWIVCDLALMAEKAIVVPLYSRQAAADLVGMLKDCGPRLLLTADEIAWHRCPQRLERAAVRRAV